MLLLGFHLWHGFQSSFQSLGLNHKKYTPLIKFLGRLYAVVVSLGFASFPVYFYFMGGK
jgi:succinate dehydrogenase / fumarate reductase cytochrome b subunit